MREKIKDEGRLQHIQSAINQLIEYKDKYEFCEVRDNPIVFYGFVKLVEIIGEAVYMLTKEFRESHSEVNWRQIERMRHILVHGYYAIDPETLWNTVECDIPELEPVIESLLERKGDG